MCLCINRMLQLIRAVTDTIRPPEEQPAVKNLKYAAEPEVKYCVTRSGTHGTGHDRHQYQPHRTLRGVLSNKWLDTASCLHFKSNHIYL